ncbi:hypothetical protein IAT40_002639 [Kwoniella sp. CBS 6097]
MVLPSIDLARNLRFDFTATLIPMLINRGSLYYESSEGNTILLEDIDQFISRQATCFKVESLNQPLFRDYSVAQSTSEPVPMTVAAFSRQLNRYCLEAGLPCGRLLHFRRNVGDITRIFWGREVQDRVLVLGFSNERGARNSQGPRIEDYPISRAVLGEFRADEKDLQRRLACSQFYERTRNGRAVDCTVRQLRKSDEIGPITIDEKEVDAQAEVDEEYQALYSYWRKLEGEDGS